MSSMNTICAGSLRVICENKLPVAVAVGVVVAVVIARRCMNSNLQAKDSSGLAEKVQNTPVAIPAAQPLPAEIPAAPELVEAPSQEPGPGLRTNHKLLTEVEQGGVKLNKVAAPSRTVTQSALVGSDPRSPLAQQLAKEAMLVRQKTSPQATE